MKKHLSAPVTFTCFDAITSMFAARSTLLYYAYLKYHSTRKSNYIGKKSWLDNLRNTNTYTNGLQIQERNENSTNRK